MAERRESMSTGTKIRKAADVCVFVADGADKRSICPANKGVVVSPEGDVKKLASYPSPWGGGAPSQRSVA